MKVKVNVEYGDVDELTLGYLDGLKKRIESLAERLTEEKPSEELTDAAMHLTVEVMGLMHLFGKYKGEEFYMDLVGDLESQLSEMNEAWSGALLGETRGLDS